MASRSSRWPALAIPGMLYARRPDPSPAQDTIQLFRAHNQRRWALEKDVVALEERVPFVCECANADCFQPIGLTMHEFEAAHMCPNWHAVLPGHADSADETVLVRDDHFWTVEVKGTVRACNRTEVDMALEAMAVEDADRLLDEAWLNGGDLERALALAKRLSPEIGRDPVIEDAKIALPAATTARHLKPSNSWSGSPRPRTGQSGSSRTSSLTE